jgi:hypothetical protein
VDPDRAAYGRAGLQVFDLSGGCVDEERVGLRGYVVNLRGITGLDTVSSCQ